MRALIIPFFLVLIAAPGCRVPTPDEQNTVTVEIVLEEIREGSSYDVVLETADGDASYYINRGLQYGVDLKEWKRELTGKTILLTYVRTPAISLLGARPVARVADADSIWWDWHRDYQ